MKSCDAAGTTARTTSTSQGTSMASPHAVGVAALIVSRYGYRDWRTAGSRCCRASSSGSCGVTATNTACPVPPEFTYTRHLPTGATVTATHICEGQRWANGFYGNGIINARRAVGHCPTPGKFFAGNLANFREVGISAPSGPSHTRHEETPRSGRGPPRSRGSEREPENKQDGPGRDWTGKGKRRTTGQGGLAENGEAGGKAGKGKRASGGLERQDETP